MNVLITGGAGYIGAHIALQFLDAGHNVTIIDRKISALTSKGQVESICVDLCDVDRLKSVLLKRHFETVVHCAALTSLPLSLSDPVGFFTNNVTGTLNLLTALQDNGPFRLIFSSTAAVYAPPSSGPVCERSTIAPATPYGESKRQCEEILRFAADAIDVKVVVLRYFNVAGADGKMRAGPNVGQAAALIPSLCRALFERSEFIIYGDAHPTADGTAVRDFIHVEDLSCVHLAFATCDKACVEPYQIYNVGYGKGYSVAEVVSTAERVVGRQVIRQIGPKRAGDLSSVVADPEKLFSTNGTISSAGRLESMISSTASWMTKLNGLPTTSLDF